MFYNTSSAELLIDKMALWDLDYLDRHILITAPLPFPHKAGL